MASSAPTAAGMPMSGTGDPKSLRLLFVEMGTGYDQHGYVFLCVVSFRVQGSFEFWVMLNVQDLSYGLRSVQDYGCSILTRSL